MMHFDWHDAGSEWRREMTDFNKDAPKVDVPKSVGPKVDSPKGIEKIDTKAPIVNPLHPSDDPNFIPLSPTQVPHGVPKEFSVWAVQDEETRKLEDEIASGTKARKETPKPGTRWGVDPFVTTPEGTVIEITEADKDQLIAKFIEEHKYFNGIPRYESMEGAMLYYNIRPTVTPPPPPLP